MKVAYPYKKSLHIKIMIIVILNSKRIKALLKVRTNYKYCQQSESFTIERC